MASWTRYGRRRGELEMYIFLCVVSNIKLSAVFRYCRENRVADRCVVYFARGEDIGFRWFRLQLEVER